jgi:hypothetical protein
VQNDVSHRVSQYLIGSIGDDAVYGMRSTDFGDLRMDVWQVRLAQPSVRTANELAPRGKSVGLVR